MEKYSKYLLECLKDHGCSHFTIINFLVHKDGYRIWETPSSPGCKTCCSIGGYNGYATYYFSTTPRIFGSAIIFASNKWKAKQTHRLEKPTDEDQCILNVCFMQMMHMLEKTNIYIAGEKIFNKGEAYRYLVEADLNS